MIDQLILGACGSHGNLQMVGSGGLL